MIKVGLIFGGKSPEHLISVRSARNIHAYFDKSKFEVLLIGIDQQGAWWMQQEKDLDKMVEPKGIRLLLDPSSEEDCFRALDAADSLPQPDVIFPIVHGPYGEDGTLQGFLKMLDLPFVGPDVLASALCMDKDFTKRVLATQDINVAPGRSFRSDEVSDIDYQSLVETFGQVLFVKPANMGSSVGVHKTKDKHSFDLAIEDAFTFDDKVLVEGFIDGREIECAVLGNEEVFASGIGEIAAAEEYSYEAKYTSESTAKVIIPALVEKEQSERLRSIALKTYKALGCEGLARVDMFLTKSGDVFVNEVNTLPGFTNISMYPQLWEAEGIAYDHLLEKLVELALERDIRLKTLQRNF